MSKSFIERLLLGNKKNEELTVIQNNQQKSQNNNSFLKQSEIKSKQDFNNNGNQQIQQRNAMNSQERASNSWENFHLKEKFFYQSIVENKDKGVLFRCLKDLIKDEKAIKEKIFGRSFKLGANWKEKKKKLEMINSQFQEGCKIKVDVENPSYEQALQIHQKWEDFMIDYLEGCKNDEQIKQRFLQTDFHGSKIIVKDSLNKNQINIQGIVIREGLHSFKIITQENKVKSLLKN